MTVSLVTVSSTGEVDASLSGMNGTVTFQPVAVPEGGTLPVPTAITSTSGGLVIEPAGVTRYVSGGSLTAEIVPTDAAGLSPPGWGYLVTVVLAGCQPRSFPALIPYSASPVPFATLVPAVLTEALVTPVASVNGKTGTVVLTASDVGAVPVSQTVTSSPGSTQSILSVQSTGGTAAVGAFGLLTGAQAISGVTGQAYFLGYNAQQITAGTSGSNGAMAASFFLDAGDTSVGGKHGIEANWGSFQTPDATGKTNALQVIAVNDNTNSVNLALRCGTGTEAGGSAIVFQNADASVTFLTMAPAGGGAAVFSVPVSVFAPTFSVSPPSGAATFIINGGAGSTAATAYQAGGVSQWETLIAAGNFYLDDVANSRLALAFTPGTATTASATVASSLSVQGAFTATGPAAVAPASGSGTALSVTGSPSGGAIQQWETASGHVAMSIDAAGNVTIGG